MHCGLHTHWNYRNNHCLPVMPLENKVHCSNTKILKILHKHNEILVAKIDVKIQRNQHSSDHIWALDETNTALIVYNLYLQAWHQHNTDYIYTRMEPAQRWSHLHQDGTNTTLITSTPGWNQHNTDHICARMEPAQHWSHLHQDGTSTALITSVLGWNENSTDHIYTRIEPAQHWSHLHQDGTSTALITSVLGWNQNSTDHICAQMKTNTALFTSALGWNQHSTDHIHTRMEPA